VDIRQLEMFRTVAEDGTFTRAAERLRISQSAVSRQVKLLEEELGGVLLHRGARRVSLTPAGELLLKMANRVHRDVQDVVSQISDTHALRRGSLTLAGGMTVCMYVLPGVLKKYRKLYPQVELRVVSGASDALLRKLRTHEVDLALLTLPVVAPDLDVRPVLREEMVVVAAPGHPLTRGRSVEPASLGKFPLILYESGSNTRRVLDQFFAEEAVHMNVAMETENVEIIKAMVAIGLGVTIVPFEAIARDVRAHGRLVYRRLRGRRLYRETGWVFLKTDHLPRTSSEMLRVFDAMRSQFGGRPKEP
jgi:LysR family transcriptional regulator, transcriptional activator of the cysJI operon